MRVGTKSLLFGAHQFVLHPLFVALAWRKLYGSWPRQWQIWLAFVVHDWGYWGLRDLDGPEGIEHPRRGARIVGRRCKYGERIPWYIFTADHSRSFAELCGRQPSPLMQADKLATVLMPLWLYATLCWLSGEWREYRDRWVIAGTYPGQPNDGVWTWAQHLRANWSRFRQPDAAVGRAYGGE